MYKSGFRFKAYIFPLELILGIDTRTDRVSYGELEKETNTLALVLFHLVADENKHF